MEELSLWQWLLILAVLSAVANGIIAHYKGRSQAAWVILGLMFNPIPLVVLLFLPSLRLDLRKPD